MGLVGGAGRGGGRGDRGGGRVSECFYKESECKKNSICFFFLFFFFLVKGVGGRGRLE